MKKIFHLILSVFMVALCSLTSCDSENSSGKISMIVSNMYGVIKPIEIYEFQDGYMYTSGRDINHRVEVELPLRYDHYAKSYSSYGKSYTVYDAYSYLQVGAHLKVTSKLIIPKSKQITPQNITFQPNYPYTVYYSELWGEKENVNFYANVRYCKTLYIKLQEKSDSYKITYYDIDGGVAFNGINSIENYKRIVEIQKNDIVKIEYFS
jgi:uncharacterized protein YxeA